MQRVFVASHNGPVASVRNLIQYINEESEGLLVRTTYRDSDTRERVTSEDILLNYGWSSTRKLFAYISGGTDRIINHPDTVNISSNKRRFYMLASACGLPIIDTTFTPEEAFSWLQEGSRVFARQKLRGSKGNGIVILSPECIGSVPSMLDTALAPMYTREFVDGDEYRLFVVAGEVVDFAKKKKLSTGKLTERGIQINRDIKTTDNGWIFGKRNVTLPEGALAVAQQVTDSLGLDFMALDLIHNRGNGDLRIMEVNSAPGLRSPTTLASIGKALGQHILSL